MINSNKGHRERLIKQFLEYPESISMPQILEILLFFIILRKDTKKIAKELLQEFKNLQNILQASKEQLTNIKNIGNKTIIYLKVLNQFYTLLQKEQIQNKNILKNFDKFINYCKRNFENSIIEKLQVYFLSNNNRIIKCDTISTGTVDHININVPKIITQCSYLAVKKIILVHNHPSGDSSPSNQDIDFTRRIIQLLSTINVQVLDHIIIGDHYFSFRENSLI